MRSSKGSRVRRALLAALATATVLGTAAPVAADDGRRPQGPALKVLAEGLSSPKGLDSVWDQPIVAQGAFGPPGPVLLRFTIPWAQGRTVELTDPLNVVDVAAAPFGNLWILGGDLVLYRKTPFGQPTPVANIAEYQQGDPDPFNADEDPAESNPYGLAALPNGDALVVDAANNDLLRVTPRGKVVTVARFTTMPVSTDHLGDPNLPPVIDAEAVPTSVTVGPDGVYVGQLPGFPFRPGSAAVWRIDPWARDAVCGTAPDPSASASRHRPACTKAMDGFTGVQDLAWDARRHRWYVYELAAGGVLAFEAGFETGEFPPAVLLEVRRDGSRRELVPGQLSQAGGVEVGDLGSLYVTDGTFTSGRLLEVRR